MQQQHVSRQRSGQDGAWILILLLTIAVVAILLLGTGAVLLWQRQRVMQVEAIRQNELARVAALEARAAAEQMQATQQALAANTAQDSGAPASRNSDALASDSSYTELFRAVLNSQLGSLKLGDGEGCMKCFSESEPIWLIADGKRFIGSEAIQDYFTDQFEIPDDSNWKNFAEEKLAEGLFRVLATLEAGNESREVLTTFRVAGQDKASILQQTLSVAQP